MVAKRRWLAPSGWPRKAPDLDSLRYNSGSSPGYEGTQRLPLLIGKGLALQLILTGCTIGAQEAYRIGLVNEVVQQEKLIGRAETILTQISANASLAVKFALEAVNKG